MIHHLQTRHPVSTAIIVIGIFCCTTAWSQVNTPEKKMRLPNPGATSYCASTIKITTGQNQQRLRTLPPEQVRKIILRDTRRLAKNDKLSALFTCLSTATAAQEADAR
jgi:hypothetical protein